MDDFLNMENLNEQWIIMNIYNQEYNIDGLFPHWVKSAMDSLTSGNIVILKNKLSKTFFFFICQYNNNNNIVKI